MLKFSEGFWYLLHTIPTVFSLCDIFVWYWSKAGFREYLIYWRLTCFVVAVGDSHFIIFKDLFLVVYLVSLESNKQLTREVW